MLERSALERREKSGTGPILLKELPIVARSVGQKVKNFGQPTLTSLLSNCLWSLESYRVLFQA